MYTTLHKKIRSMCYFPNDGSEHWILKGAKTVWVADIRRVCTTKRAAYAAFRGPVPEDQDVRAVCGSSHCIAPHHAELHSARRLAAALALPTHIASLARANVFAPPDPVGILPKGLTLHLLEMTKYLSANGNTTAQIRSATGLTAQEIVKIRSGAYDAIAAKLTEKRSSRRGYKDAGNAKDPSEISADSLPGAIVVVDTSLPVDDDVDIPDMTEEEQAWLNMVNRR